LFGGCDKKKNFNLKGLDIAFQKSLKNLQEQQNKLLEFAKELSRPKPNREFKEHKRDCGMFLNLCHIQQ